MRPIKETYKSGKEAYIREKRPVKETDKRGMSR